MTTSNLRIETGACPLEQYGPVHLHYTEIGPEDGRPIIFLHGSGPGASAWSNFQIVATRLATEYGFRCILPDLVGYGESWDPAWGKDWFKRGSNPFDQHVDAICSLIDWVDADTCTLVGNSQGGAIALRIAASEEFEHRIEKLSLLAPGGLGDKKLYMTMPGIQAITKYVFPSGDFSTPPNLTAETMTEIFRLMFCDEEMLDATTIAERTVVANRTPIQRAMAFTKVRGVQECLSDITCPVQIVWGRQDKFCPYDGMALLEQGLTNAALIETYPVPRSGHWVHVERAGLYYNRLVSFIG